MYHQTSSPSSQADASVLMSGLGVDGPRTPTSAVPTVVPISHSLEKQITEIEQRLKSLQGKPADDLLHDLQIWAKEAERSAGAAITAAHNAIIHAWATGTLLNLAKDNLGRGRFGPWRDAKASEIGISTRTSQNWMKLAERCWDVRALLAPGTSLTSAYRAAGVLPEPTQMPPSVDDGVEDAEKPPTQPASFSAEPVFRALTEVRKHLRHLIESGVILDDDQRDRLEEEKSSYLNLIDKLLNPIVP
jgi:hypothetical protein